MIDAKRIAEVRAGLIEQRNAIQVEINMIAGAIQLCDQLLSEGEAETSPEQKEVKHEEAAQSEKPAG